MFAHDLPPPAISSGIMEFEREMHFLGSDPEEAQPSFLCATVTPPGLQHFSGPHAFLVLAWPWQVTVSEQARVRRMFQHAPALLQPLNHKRAEILFPRERLGLMSAVCGP
jgi:hypothetical protein